MKHRTLQDIAKFLSGLVLGDFLSLWWFAAHTDLSVQFLGMTFNQAAILPGMVFDAALLIFLVYYGWHLGKLPAIRERTYHFIAGVIFGIVALAHLVRLMSGTSFVLLGWAAPFWLSWVGTAVAAILSYMSFRLMVARKR